MSLLSLAHVGKCYWDGRLQIKVLEDACLDVEAGEWVGVWGARRSGKSTLLQLMAARLQPDEGDVLFAGVSLTSMSSDARARMLRSGGLGVLEGDWRPQRNQPAIEHVALPLLSDGMSLREARRPAYEALERTGVAGCAHMMSGRLSAAERVRVDLARVLVRRPRVVMVDEPGALLRPSEAVQLYELLRALSSTDRVAVVLASEELAPLRSSQRIVSIGDGRLRAMEQPGTLVQFPDQPRRRS